MRKHEQQTLALAGIAQAAFLVDQLANRGLAAQDKLSTCLESLFVTKPKNTLEVYGSINRLALGLQLLEEIFITKANSLRNPGLMRYFIGMVYLETRLCKRPEMMQFIAKGLEQTKEFSQLSSMQITDNPRVIEQLAQLYLQTASTMSFRIQVQGNPKYLKNSTIPNTVRSVLLAGIRSAVLWRQLGGRRWHFLFLRRRIAIDIQNLLRQFRN
jgi:high frequency lysogenization protein